jgi:undecaprenyl diphosphate synthase
VPGSLDAVRIIEEAELERVREGEIPRHIGCIMDGNGRWALMRGLERTKGHEAAEPAVRAVVDACLELGVPWLSAYAFSSENWSRSADEVRFLMNFEEWLFRKTDRDEMAEQGVRFRFVGRRDDHRLPVETVNFFEETEAMTESNDRLNLVIACNYGGRQELVDAVNSLLAAGVERVDEQQLDAAMYLADMPDHDLVLRTSSEHRLSNFFPWHTTYAELVFTDALWPDVRAWHIYSAVAEFQSRRRRKGAESTNRSPS